MKENRRNKKKKRKKKGTKPPVTPWSNCRERRQPRHNNAVILTDAASLLQREQSRVDAKAKDITPLIASRTRYLGSLIAWRKDVKLVSWLVL